MIFLKEFFYFLTKFSQYIVNCKQRVYLKVIVRLLIVTIFHDAWLCGYLN